MYFERVKLIERTIEEEVARFVTGIHLPFHSEDSLCEELVAALGEYLGNVKAKPNFGGIFDRFNHADAVPKTKSRLCGGILKKGDRAYKCHECITEENSIVCLACFDQEKHKGHQFELISVFGGCCDCGDQEKWNSQTFCKTHSSDEEIQVLLDPKLLATFLEEQLFGFKTILFLYSSYLQEVKHLETIKLPEQNFTEQDNKKVRSMVKSKILMHLENYCILYFKQLIDFNSNGKYANSMTEKLLESRVELDFPSFPVKGKGKEMTFFELLFSFLMFDKVPEIVCELCITLFQLNDFREILTIQYIDFYINVPQFATSNYSHLSSQLFTSYLAISKLVREKRIPPLEIFPMLNAPSDLQEACQAYVRYYYDINYLAKLYGQASIDYFRYHAQQNKIVQFGDYRRKFNNVPSAKDYYGLEEIFVNRILNVARVMQRDKTSFIIKASLRQLYQFISNFANFYSNYFRPQERLFTMLTLIYFNGELNALDNDETMIEYLAILGISSLETEVEVILQNICSLFSFVSHLFQNQKKIGQCFTCFSFYFKKNNMLFNLDALLLKIMIKICEFHNRNNSEKINYSKIIKKADRFFNVVNKMEDYQNGTEIKSIETAKEDGLALTQENFKHFFSYVALLNEAIVSDLPQLAIKCFIKPTKEEVEKYKLPQISYEAEARHYYQNILKSCENAKVSIKDFKAICDLFFKEQEVFKEFVNAHMDTFDNRKLDAEKSKGEKINLMHFKSVSLRAAGISPNGSISYLPYFQQAQPIDFFQTTLIVLSNKCMEFLSDLQKSYQAQGMANSKSLILPNYVSLFNLLWIVFLQTENEQLYNFITVSLSNEQLKAHLDPLLKEVKAYSNKLKNEEMLQENSAADSAQSHRKKDKREKLLNKRNEMKERMNKNKDFFKNQEVVEQDHSQLCCLCKQTKEDEVNCLIAMISQTNYNNWANLSPMNNLYSINSCGHHVHRSCYSKILKKNQIYSFCPLCRKPMNIIIPQLSSKASNENSMQFWQEFHRINKNFNLQVKRDAEGSLIFLSLVSFAVIRGLLFPKIFKKELRTYRALVGLLFWLIRNDKEQFFFNEELEVVNLGFREDHSQEIEDVFTHFTHLIYGKLFGVDYHHSETINSAMRERAEKIAKVLFNEEGELQQNMETELGEVQLLRSTIPQPKVEDSLSQLSSKYLGKCPNCSLVTNQQAACLICPNFYTCISCVNMKLMSHAEQMHKSTCAFLKTSTGEVVYIYRNRFWIFESIYEDYMGRFFSQLSPSSKSQYHLNQKKLLEFREDIINNSIESRLRYKEKQSNRVNHDQQL